MLEKLKQIEVHYNELEQQLALPEIYSDPLQVAKIAKEQKDLSPIIMHYRAYRTAETREAEAKDLLNAGNLEPDFKEMVQEELEEAKQEMERLQEELKILLLPRDPNDEKNVIVEIRGGAGGEEAALFAHSLYRMYTMYAERNHWKIEIMNLNETELGGVKEIEFLIEGSGAYSRLKFESGVHRVQRVPDTESGGRVHTSTVTVAVLPEAEEVELEINPGDLQIDTFRSSGAGGQHVNKTESAIRITHLPTGLVVECQDERSQHKNRDKAMKVLRSKLLEAEREKQTSAIAAERKSQVGTGMRNERIRTYNFPQGRVTDHRIGLTLYKIDAIMNGDLDELVDALVTADQAEKLSASEADGE
ncbi:MAG: peptide chain release factor 1 [Oscillospiraceae bacterium]|nr:peptide chain release factor 1 [Oscillospiraceae bacterium]